MHLRIFCRHPNICLLQPTLLKPINFPISPPSKGAFSFRVFRFFSVFSRLRLILAAKKRKKSRKTLKICDSVAPTTDRAPTTFRLWATTDSGPNVGEPHQPHLPLLRAAEHGEAAQGGRRRSGLKKLIIFSKFREARSRLYRRRFSQPNTHWKAFFEIYKISIPLHRSDLKISAKRLQQIAKNPSKF